LDVYNWELAQTPASMPSAIGSILSDNAIGGGYQKVLQWNSQTRGSKLQSPYFNLPPYINTGAVMSFHYDEATLKDGLSGFCLGYKPSSFRKNEVSVIHSLTTPPSSGGSWSQDVLMTGMVFSVLK
jgi:hypothetical protein